MDNARTAFFKALKSFPRWMDIRKRPVKSVGGHLLQSIMDEQAEIIKAHEAFKKDFFLLSYVGREEAILDHVYVYQIGEVDASKVTIETCDAKLTSNPRAFLTSFDEYCLYQEGYILMAEQNVAKDKRIRLLIDGYAYGGIMKRLSIWNIFDEFALFLGLERFEEENNEELLHRCFAVFKNPTNSTAEGLKNAIANAVMNVAPVDRDAIRIESLTADNMRLTDSFGENVYEKLARFNHDVFRMKKWDMDTWEHGFKKLDFIPHEWDAPMQVSQDGVGQQGDLKVSFSNEAKDPETTDLDITGYKADTVAVSNYVLSRNIKKEIPLKLEKYKNVLNPKKVEYKITAAPVTELRTPGKVFVQTFAKESGTTTQYLEDTLVSPGSLSVNETGALQPAHEYRIVFKARTPYSDMVIDRINFTNNGITKSLMKETEAFKQVEGSLKSVDTAFHASKVGALKACTNLVDGQEGIHIAPGCMDGIFSVDVTGMGGEYVTIEHDCDAEDITRNRGLVTYSEDVAEDEDGALVADGTASGGAITIDVRGYHLSFEYENPTRQGSCSVIIMVDGQLDTLNSGLWTDSRSFCADYDACKEIHVEIVKTGMHAIRIADIKAKRYRIECSLVNQENRKELLDLSYGKAIPYLRNPDEENTLCVRMWNYGTKQPVIHFIHVGASMEYVSYEVDAIKAAVDASLDIRTNCRVELYDTTGGRQKLLSDDYSTRMTYTNLSEDDVYVPIDTSKFPEIQQSSRKIETALLNGRTVKCIRVQPHETVRDIQIKGVSYTLRSSDSIAALLDLKKDEKIYVCSNAGGFIIKDTASSKERIGRISREKFPSTSDSFSLVDAPEEMAATFVTDEANGKRTTATSFDRTFEYLYIQSDRNIEYIAYNNATLFQSELRGVPVVNTFSPIFDTTKLMYYEISDVVRGSSKSIVMFEKGAEPPARWRLGLQVQGSNPSTVVIQTDMQYSNSDSYGVEAERLNESYTISNKIPLPETVTVGDEHRELACYIITPPENIRISYREEACKEENVIVEDDGFNKLYYSNVINIQAVECNGKVVSPSAYSLLNGESPDGGREGIILWSDSSLRGKKVDIYYTYKIPVSMKYASMRDLYELVGYTTDAYRRINALPIHLEDMHDGDKSQLDFGEETPDKIIVRCSNQNFDAIIDGCAVKVQKNVREPQALIKTGYYYDDGDEYYLYNHLHEEKIDRLNGVELFNVKVNAGVFEFVRKSTNHLRDSTFHPKRLDVVCDIDCKANERLCFANKLHTITACDSYNMWDSFNMMVSMQQGLNGLGIKFTPTDRVAYAIMDITHVARPGMMITYFLRGAAAKSFIMEEQLENDELPMVKSVYARQLVEVEKDADDVAAYCFPGSLDARCRHYLMVQGECIIDDIIAKKQEPSDIIADLHKKALDCIGVSIQEQVMAETKIPLRFDPVGNKLEGLDIAKDGHICPGSNVDWGLTKIYDIRDDMERCTIRNGIVRHGAVYAEAKDAILRTPAVFLMNAAAMNSIIVKINDVLIDEMSGFGIRVFASESEYGPYSLVSDRPKTNLARIFASKLSPYVQLEINIPEGRVIQSVEVYAEYVENADAPLHVYSNDRSSLTSKIYDTACRASYRLARIDGAFKDMEHVQIYVRGLRRDTGHEVWTKWYLHEFDASLHTINPHIFEDYQMFQFKVVLDSSKAECLIENYVLEVV